MSCQNPRQRPFSGSTHLRSTIRKGGTWTLWARDSFSYRTSGVTCSTLETVERVRLDAYREHGSKAKEHDTSTGSSASTGSGNEATITWCGNNKKKETPSVSLGSKYLLRRCLGWVPGGSKCLLRRYDWIPRVCHWDQLNPKGPWTLHGVRGRTL